MELVIVGQFFLCELSPPVQQVPDQIPPEPLGIGLAAALVRAGLCPGLQPEGYLLQGLIQFGLIHRLEDVIAHAQRDGGLGILKLGVPADNNDFDVGVVLPGLTDEVKPVAPGHTDIGNQQVGLELLHHLEGLQAVFRPADNLHIQLFPIHQGFDQPAHQLFVIRNNDFPHKAPPFLVMLCRKFLL